MADHGSNFDLVCLNLRRIVAEFLLDEARGVAKLLALERRVVEAVDLDGLDRLREDKSQLDHLRVSADQGTKKLPTIRREDVLGVTVVAQFAVFLTLELDRQESDSSAYTVAAQGDGLDLISWRDVTRLFPALGCTIYVRLRPDIKFDTTEATVGAASPSGNLCHGFELTFAKSTSLAEVLTTSNASAAFIVRRPDLILVKIEGFSLEARTAR